MQICSVPNVPNEHNISSSPLYACMQIFPFQVDLHYVYICVLLMLKQGFMCM